MLNKLLPVRLLGIFNGLLPVRKLSTIRIFALFFSVGLGLSITLSACSNNTSNSVTTQAANQSPTSKGVVIHIGYQKAATIAAFEGNNVEAWAIWDPYLAAAEAATGARTLTDGTGLAPNRGYYLAAKSFVQKQPDALKTIIEQVKKTSEWAQKNPTEVAKFLSPELGIDAAVLEVA